MFLDQEVTGLAVTGWIYSRLVVYAGDEMILLSVYYVLFGFHFPGYPFCIY